MKKIHAYLMLSMLLGCSHKVDRTDRAAVANAVIAAYQQLDTSTLLEHTMVQFREDLPLDLEIRRANNAHGLPFTVARDTFLATNQIYYVQAEYSDGRKEVFGFVRDAQSKEWFIHPGILGDPFEESDRLRELESLLAPKGQ